MKKSMLYTSYIPLIPPRPLDYYNWKRKEALEFLAWHVEQVPIRAKYIVDFISEDTDTPDLALMGNEEKLIHIWRWFLRVAEIEPLSNEELKALAPIRAKFGPSSELCSTVRLSVRTEYLIRDIGMLFAQLLLEQSENLSWTVVTKPKTDVFFHHPVLTGFIMTQYTPPFHAVADPIYLTGGQAAKLLIKSKTANETDLWEVFNQWAKYSLYTKDSFDR